MPSSNADQTLHMDNSSPAMYAQMEAHFPQDSSSVVLLNSNLKTIPTPVRPGKSEKLHLTYKGESPAPLYATERHQPSRSVSFEHRRASLCIVRDSSLRSTALLESLFPERKPLLHPPNEHSVPEKGLYEQTSFVVNRCVPRVGDVAYCVQLHIYDLTKGLVNKYSKEVVGTQVPGIYHSAIVCYGCEFYFEGGIAMAAAGSTRFGRKYKTITLGTTDKSFPDFIAWVMMKEQTNMQLHDYHPVRHNCHHFTNEAAEFLLGEEDLVPSYLFTTINEMVKTEVGAAVQEALLLTTCGIQYTVARLSKLRVVERQRSVDMLINSATACGIFVRPPTVAILFRVDSRSRATQTLLALQPYVRHLIAREIVKEKSTVVLEKCAEQLASGFDTIDADYCAGFVELVTQSLLNTQLPLWFPVLNSLRVAVLHKEIATLVVFHPELLSLLLLGVRSFYSILPAGRLSLLRVVCNLGASVHGAVALNDARYFTTWVSLVGQGLMDTKHEVTVYTAACLAVNLATICIVITGSSLQRQMSMNVAHHPLSRLATILLYNLKYRSDKQMGESTFNMILLALFRIMSANSTALEFICSHSFSIDYKQLLQRAMTNESKALVVLMKTVEDLYLYA